MMEKGRFGTTNELAATEKINSSYVSRLLRLTLPALMTGFRWSGTGRAGVPNSPFRRWPKPQVPVGPG